MRKKIETTHSSKLRPTFVFFHTAAALLLSSQFSAVDATLTDATVNLSVYFPNDTTVLVDPGNRVVSDAIEYPAGTFEALNESWAANINHSQIILIWTNPTGGTFRDRPFNGFVFDVLSGPHILGATINPMSDFSPLSVTIDGSNRLLLNYQSVFYRGAPSYSIIDLQFEVPEPTPLLALGPVLAAMAGNRRLLRRRRPA